MNGPAEDSGVDPELKQLVSEFLDARLDAKGQARLEERLRHEVGAREYYARELRFDAAMQEALDPSELEFLETRRLKLGGSEGKTGWRMELNRSIRYGQPLGEKALDSRSLRRWWILGGGLALVLTTVASILFLKGRSEPHELVPRVMLKNASFEATDLTFLPATSNSAVVDWQDYFMTSEVTLCEVSRMTGGKILPRSGRNVVRCRSHGYLTQRLVRTDGSPVLAVPGSKLIVSGWAHRDDSPSPHGLRGAVRFVAGSKPGMIQYEATSAEVAFHDVGWQHFRLVFSLPDNLVVAASDIDAGVSEPPKLDLEGKALTLSLDGRSPGSFLFLDDLEIEEISTAKGNGR